jgi:hypothetical protein
LLVKLGVDVLSAFLASDVIVFQPVGEIVARGWPGHEAICPPKPGKPMKK